MMLFCLVEEAELILAMSSDYRASIYLLGAGASYLIVQTHRDYPTPIGLLVKNPNFEAQSYISSRMNSGKD
jgi:hypothetical protein